jgi:hypothetical protein
MVVAVLPVRCGDLATNSDSRRSPRVVPLSRATFRIVDSLLARIRGDLRRAHPFAAERVGFVLCRVATGTEGWTILAYDHLSIADDSYIDDPRFGAVISSAGFLPPLQAAYEHPICICHAHLHDHPGRTRFSGPDEVESARFMLDFLKVRPDLPHCAVVIGEDHLWGKYWIDPKIRGRVISEFHVVGAPLLTSWNDDDQTP